jgi:hypothetical protein
MRPHFPTQVFGFAFTGVAFDTFVAAVASRVDKDIFNVPECVVVHKKNYMCVRVTRRAAKPDPPPPDPRLCVAIDFSQAGQRLQNVATAYFLYLYHQRVKDNVAFAVDMLKIHVRDWRLPEGAVRVIEEDGTVTTGFAP